MKVKSLSDDSEGGLEEDVISVEEEEDTVRPEGDR